MTTPFADEKEVVKVQQPFIKTCRHSAVTSNPDHPWLIYDKGFKHVHHVPDRVISSDVKRRMGSQLKMFYYAVWSPDDHWSLDSPAPWQEW